jgi:hypothetical protein
VIAAVLALLVWLAILGLFVGWIWLWVFRSVSAAARLRRRAKAGAWPSPRPVAVRVDLPEPVCDAGATSVMYVSLMDDGRDIGKRERVRMVAAGDGLRMAEPVTFANPDRPWDEVGVYDRSSEHGGQPLARLSRWLVANDDGGVVTVGERDLL